MNLESPRRPLPGIREILGGLSLQHATNAVVAFIFAASGPVAIILSVATQGGLAADQIASWLFGAFFLNGLVTIPYCLAYRQPLVFFWTIPGAVLVGPALAHASFPEVVGAYVVTGLLMLALALSGLVRRGMAIVPLPIVMGMVAGVFLPFGLGWIAAFQQNLPIAAGMTGAFLLASAVPALARRVPPLIVALLAGALLAVLTDGFGSVDGLTTALAVPRFVVPEFSGAVMLELVVPLAITVLVIQNSQGIAVLTAGGHQPPTNSIAAACGVGSMVTALVGSVPTCLTGPVNAILAASGERATQYTAGILVALLGMAFGLFAPVVTHVMLAAPPALIAVLAGLAMLRVLAASFAAAFKGPFMVGALVTFLVTVAGLPILNVGAPFWGLVFGVATSLILERHEFARARSA